MVWLSGWFWFCRIILKAILEIIPGHSGLYIRQTHSLTCYLTWMPPLAQATPAIPPWPTGVLELTTVMLWRSFTERCSGTWEKLVSRTVTIYIINIRDTMWIWLVHWLLLFDIELYKYDLRRVKCLANEGNWCHVDHPATDKGVCACTTRIITITTMGPRGRQLRASGLLQR